MSISITTDSGFIRGFEEDLEKDRDKGFDQEAAEEHVGTEV